MPYPTIPAFTPTEIWTPNSPDFVFEEPILQARAEMNRKNPEQLVHLLKHSVERSASGVSYALLRGETPAEYSDSDALVIMNPFAHAATPNMLVRGEFIREVAKQYDVRDESGKLKPVILLANPGHHGSRVRLSSTERQAARRGELGPISRELLRSVSDRDIGRVTLLGFSEGADLVLAGSRSLYAANLDIQAIAVGDPAGNETRTKRELAGDFFKTSGKDFRDAVAASGLEAQKKVIGRGIADFLEFAVSTPYPLNMTAFGGLGQDVFEGRVQEILEEGSVTKLVAGYATDSAIAKPLNIEPALQHLYDNNGRDSVTSIRVEGANHTWGDQLPLLAKLYMRAATS